eukprot:871251-Karenia_brevis.AAC.1
MTPPAFNMQPDGSVQNPEKVIFASFRPKSAKMTPPGSYMEPGAGGSVSDPERLIFASFRPK